MRTALCSLLFILCSVAAYSQKKIALVIGAQNYTSLPPLRNSLNDAVAISRALQQKGFVVQALYDPKTSRQIKDGIQWYYDQIKGQTGAVGMIYYAGHGMQYKGDNYLIPTTVALNNSGDLEDCIKMNRILSILDETSTALHMLVLDACRTLPSFTRDTEQGLSKMSPPEGSIIVFSTKAGRTASDGQEANGLFTSKLLKVMNEPGLNVNLVFKKVQQEVYVSSNKEQLPELDDLFIGGDFYFTPGTALVTPNYSEPIQQPVTVNPTSTTNEFDYGYGSSDAPIVSVGSQQWMGKNLNVDRFTNGDLIPEARTAEEWKQAALSKKPAWCYFNNDVSNGQTYGRLYNWYAVNDPRGLAPKGWHVPSNDEWRAVMNVFSGQAVAGRALKSTFGWYNGGNGNNESKMNALAGGYRTSGGSFAHFGSVSYWWSSSGLSNGNAWDISLEFTGDSVGNRPDEKGGGCFVRCLKAQK